MFQPMDWIFKSELLQTTTNAQSNSHGNQRRIMPNVQNWIWHWWFDAVECLWESKKETIKIIKRDKKTQLRNLKKSKEKKLWRELQNTPEIKGNDKVLIVPSTYARMQTFGMTLSEIFDINGRGDVYLKLPQFLKDVKISDLPYDMIKDAICRTLSKKRQQK